MNLSLVQSGGQALVVSNSHWPLTPPEAIDRGFQGPQTGRGQGAL